MSGTEPDGARPDVAVQRFWATARDAARLSTLPGYLPSTSLELVTPPTWSFGDDETGDALLELVLAGTKTATASDPAAYAEAGEALPTPGTLGIVVDSAGRPRVLVETTEVRVVPFAEVDVEHARAEGEGDLSLEHWREVHEVFFRDQGAEVTPEMPVLLERLRVLHRA